jgi:hypothetical protein
VDRVFINDGKEVERETMTTVYRAAPEVVCGKKPKDEDKKDKKPKRPGAVDPSAEPSPEPSPSVAVEGDTFENTAAGSSEREKKKDKKPAKKKDRKPQKANA